MTVAPFRCGATIVLLAGVLFIAGCSQKASSDPKPRTIDVDLGGGVMMTLVSIPAGSFMMGSENDVEAGRVLYRHEVTLTQPFYLGKYPVTQQQWQAVMGNNPSNYKSEKLPVESVSWEDAQEFLKKLQAKSPDLKFALPTEAQWEFACRGGNSHSVYQYGDDGPLEFYAASSQGETHDVGTKKPNASGLYDMHGNVREWCADWYADMFTTDAQQDPVGPSSGTMRVLRGGAWGFLDPRMRSTIRSSGPPDLRHCWNGLRVAVVAP